MIDMKICIQIVLILFFLPCCLKEHSLDKVIAMRQNDLIYFIEQDDTLAYFPTSEIDFEVAKLRQELFDGKDFNSLKRGWSCVLFEGDTREEMFKILSFDQLEVAIQKTFKESGAEAISNDAKALFLSRTIFQQLVAFPSKRDEEYACEEEYIKTLSQALIHPDTNKKPSSFLRGLDSCQIVETIESSERIRSLEENEFVFTPASCLEDNEGFIHNKPYFMVTFYERGELEIILANPSYAFKWLEI